MLQNTLVANQQYRTLMMGEAREWARGRFEERLEKKR